MLLMQSFGKPSILIIGCGDIGLRVAKQLSRSHRVFALTSQQNRFQELRELGVIPIWGDLDKPETLWRLSGLAPEALKNRIRSAVTKLFHRLLILGFIFIELCAARQHGFDT